MADNTPPTTVSALIARVAKVTARIDQHRAAMAQVAAQVRPPKPPETPEGVTNQ